MGALPKIFPRLPHFCFLRRFNFRLGSILSGALHLRGNYFRNFIPKGMFCRHFSLKVGIDF